MNEKSVVTIAVAGANGFIGRSLIEILLNETDFHIIALSRREKHSLNPRLKWKKCDLFSLKDVEESIAEAQIGIYLVHSMVPTARLDQGSFSDYDLILADNFARAVSSLEVNHLIYLGGITSDVKSQSDHLQSRLDVELIFRQFKIPATFLRSGLILGKGGASSEILFNLIRRLPVILCPLWSSRPTTISSLRDVLLAIKTCLVEPSHLNKLYELSSTEAVTYEDLLKESAKVMGLKRLLLRFPFNAYFFSRWWVLFLSGAPRSLVYPLISSLKSSMVARPDRLFPIANNRQSLTSILKDCFSDDPLKLFQFNYFQPERKEVRSVQRMILPKAWNARDVAREYMIWLPRFLNPFVIVEIMDMEISFALFHKGLVLLQLVYAPERSTLDRQLFYIKGGWLVHPDTGRGRLEFREVLNKQFVISAIHEFRPRLPWFIYRYTQAILHAIVMMAFGRHLQKKVTAQIAAL